MKRSAKQYPDENQFMEILDSIGKVRVGVLGDFCMDIYWHADMTRSTLSRETPHFPLPVVSERMSPGAAGNVAANIAALQPKKLIVLGAIGKDWRGALLKDALSALGAEVRMIESEGRMTNAYIKPMMKGTSDVVYEAPRLDFENDKALDCGAEEQLIEALREAAQSLDVLCVCDQMVNGCVTDRVREAVMRLAEEGLTVIADSRDNIGKFRNVIVKPNDIEAARALGRGPVSPGEAAEQLSGMTGKPAVVTAGPDGCWLCAGETAVNIPAFPVEGPIDICGAGDSFLSAFACCIGGGADELHAAAVGNLASSVTIQKIGMTGTATREELRKAYNR